MTSTGTPAFNEVYERSENDADRCNNYPIYRNPNGVLYQFDGIWYIETDCRPAAGGTPITNRLTPPKDLRDVDESGVRFPFTMVITCEITGIIG